MGLFSLGGTVLLGRDCSPWVGLFSLDGTGLLEWDRSLPWVGLFSLGGTVLLGGTGLLALVFSVCLCFGLSEADENPPEHEVCHFAVLKAARGTCPHGQLQTSVTTEQQRPGNRSKNISVSHP